MTTLLIVANCPSDSCLQLKDAVIQGAKNNQIKIQFKLPLEATVDDVLNCDGIIIGTTENFAYMSGQIKDFFERIYPLCLEPKQGLPIALYVKAGNDGTGAIRSIEPILTGLKWKLIQPPLLIKGNVIQSHIEACQKLAATMSAGLEMGIF